MDAATIKSVLERDEIRRILASPRALPRAVREDIAEIVAYEIVTGKSYEIRDSGKFARRLGAFYLIFLALRNSPEWRACISLSQRSASLPVLALKAVLPKIFDLLEEFAKFEPDLQKAIDKDMSELLEEFKRILEATLRLWGRRSSPEAPVPPKPRELAEFFREIRVVADRAVNNGLPDEEVQALLRQSRLGTDKLRLLSDILTKRAQHLSSSDGPSGEKAPAFQERMLEGSAGFAKMAHDFGQRVRVISPASPGGAVPHAAGQITSLGSGASDVARALEDFAGKTDDSLGEPGDDGPEALQEDVERFKGLGRSQEFMRAVVGALLGPEISAFVRRMEASADLLDTLSLLFPGRDWDYTLLDLHTTFLGDLERYSKILERNKDVTKMLDLMGRIELEYGSKRVAVSPFGTSEVHSVTKSKDIQRVLPVELVKLRDPTLKTLFFANWLEGNLLTYDLRGKHWVGGPPTKKRKGPVVALVDTSGSMGGSPEIVAKSLMFAIARKMLRAKRDVKVVMFSSTNQTSEIELTSTKKMGREFLEFLGHTFGGGTDFNTALKAGLESVETRKFRGADLLFITDGLSTVSDASLVERWTRFKKQSDSRIFTVIVGNDTAGGLEALSDQTHFLVEGEDWTVDSSPAEIVRLISSPVPRPA